MNYTVRISDAAMADLGAIFDYIAIELRSVQNAVSQYERLEREIMSLDQMPERYRRYDREPWYSRGLRMMSVDRYCVFYIPDSRAKTVDVLRVVYGGRDIAAELEKYSAED